MDKETRISAVSVGHDGRGSARWVAVYVGADVATDPKNAIRAGDRFVVRCREHERFYEIWLTRVAGQEGVAATVQPSPDRPLRVVKSGCPEAAAWPKIKMARVRLEWVEERSAFRAEVSKSSLPEVPEVPESLAALVYGGGSPGTSRRETLEEVALWLLRNGGSRTPAELAAAILKELDDA